MTVYFLVSVPRDGIEQSRRNRQSSVRAAECELFIYTESVTILSYYINITGEKVRIWPSYTNLTRGEHRDSRVNRGASFRQGRRKGEKKWEMGRVRRWCAWAPARSKFEYHTHCWNRKLVKMRIRLRLQLVVFAVALMWLWRLAYALDLQWWHGRNRRVPAWKMFVNNGHVDFELVSIRTNLVQSFENVWGCHYLCAHVATIDWRWCHPLSLSPKPEFQK